MKKRGTPRSHATESHVSSTGACGLTCRRTHVWLIELAAFAVMTAACLALTWDRVNYHRWGFILDCNSSLLEGLSWLHGRMDLPRSSTDVAYIDGKAYNVFPPLFTILSTIVLELRYLLTGIYYFDAWIYRLVILIPLAITTFWAFRATSGSPWKAALLGVCLIAGTPLLPQLVACQKGFLWQINHVLATVGLLLIAGDCLGRRRLWPSLLGLLIAAWTRQLTVFYFIPVAIIVVRGKAGWAGFIGTLILVLGIPMVLNNLKFGSPFESGYTLIYEHRNDPIAQRARHGLFSSRFVGENFYYMNLCLPLALDKNGHLKLVTNEWGGSIWLGTPLMLYIFASFRSWWNDHPRRWLVLGTVPVVLLLLLYHNTGWFQPGHYRFGLDFIPLLLAVASPYLWGRWRTPLTFALIAWSVFYYRWVAGIIDAWLFSG